jgi:hypothetical protein
VTSRARLIGTSFGAGLLLAAAQLGVGGGIGLLDWRTPAAYTTTLPWVAFIFTAATLGGVAAAKRRVAGAHAMLVGAVPQASALRKSVARIGVTVAAGLGSLAMLPLVWMPVRAGVPGVDNAAGTVVGCAAAGVAVGMIFGVAALAAGPVAAGVAGSALWLWAAAIATAVLAAVRGGPGGAPLGVVEAPGSASQWWSGPYAMVGLYATLAFTVAIFAARFGAPRRQVALSGLVGPALLASAYAIAGSGGSVDPGSATGPVAAGSPVGGSLDSLASASSVSDVRIAALVAALAGLLASTAVAMRRTRSVAPAPVGAAVWPAEGSGPAVTTAVAASATATRGTATRARANPAVARPAVATVAETPRTTRKAKRAADPAPAVPAPSAPAPSVPAQRKATSRKSAAPKSASPKVASPKPTSRKPAGRKAAAVDVAAEVRPEPVAETRQERRLEPVAEAERMSRREREHVKWMENLLNTPPDPTLTTRRSSSS